MKVKVVVALLGLSASLGALADPLVENSAAPSVIGATPASEGTLQSIADGLFGPGHINVNTNQSSAGQWMSATPSAASSIPTLVAEFTANDATQVFGIWFGTDTSAILTYDLLKGGGAVGDNAAISFSGNTLNVGTSIVDNCFNGKINCGSITDARISADSFGFYFRPSMDSQTFYSLDQLNAPNVRTDRFIAFQDGSTTNWLFAYEDGSDFDYNDMAVKVESINAVPEPETYALMLAGLGAMGFMARRRKVR